MYDAETAQNVAPVATKAYDFVGNVIDEWDARNLRTHYEYDAANRRTDAYIGYQTASQIHTQTTYDAAGNPVQVRDGRGNDTLNTYDPANRLKTSTNPEGITTEFQYDNAGNRVGVIDGKGQRTRFEYDGLNRLTKTTDAAGVAETLSYDAENKTSRIDSQGRRTTYSYDALRRLTSVLYSANPVENRIYTYDAENNILTVDQSDAAADVTYSYDALNWLVTETSNGVQHSYTYDLAGNRLGVTYGGTGRSLVMTYDALNRLSSLTDGAKVTEYRYTLTGGEASKVYKATGTTETSKVNSTFDLLGRLDIRAGFEGANQIYSYDHGYDDNGNLTNLSETYSTGLTNRVLSMSYDRANRLEEESITAASVTTATGFEYDSADNRVGRTIASGTNVPVADTYTYKSLNQLTAVASGTAPGVNFKYDRSGNRVSRVQSGSSTLYEYDQENRLTTVQLGGEAKTVNISPVMSGTLGPATEVTYYLTGGTRSHYKYDHRTRRIERTDHQGLVLRRQ